MRYTAIITGNLCDAEKQGKQRIVIQPAPFFFTE